MWDCTRNTRNHSAHVRVLVLHSSRIAREALCQLLGTLGFAVAGVGRNAAEALQDVRPDDLPNLLIASLASDAEAELALPVIREIRGRLPGLKAVVLADCGRLGVVTAAMRAGADAVLSTDISADVLKRSLELVLLGQRLFPPDIAEAFLEPMAPAEAGRNRGDPEDIAHAPDPNTVVGRRLSLLSKREHEILCCLVNGMSNKLIARTLDITEATVKVHIKGVLRKTRLGNRTQVAIWALNNNIWNKPPPAQIAGPHPTALHAHIPAVQEGGISGDPACHETVATTRHITPVNGSHDNHGIPAPPHPATRSGSGSIVP